MHAEPPCKALDLGLGARGDDENAGLGWKWKVSEAAQHPAHELKAIRTWKVQVHHHHGNGLLAEEVVGLGCVAGKTDAKAAQAEQGFRDNLEVHIFIGH